MFERFTEKAKSMVTRSQEEARRLNHNYIGTEHLLLAMLDGGGAAQHALNSLGFTLDDTREKVKQIVGEGGSSPSGHIPFTPRAKKALELALRSALQLSHNYIGTEHVLLGLNLQRRDDDSGVAAKILDDAGWDVEQIEATVMEVLGDPQFGPKPQPSKGASKDLVENLVVPPNRASKSEGVALRHVISLAITRIESGEIDVGLALLRLAKKSIPDE